MQWRVCHPLRCARSPFPKLATAAAAVARRAPCPGHLAFTTISRPPSPLYTRSVPFDRPTDRPSIPPSVLWPLYPLSSFSIPLCTFPPSSSVPACTRARRFVSPSCKTYLLHLSLSLSHPASFSRSRFLHSPSSIRLCPFLIWRRISEGRAGLAWRYGEENKQDSTRACTSHV